MVGWRNKNNQLKKKLSEMQAPYCSYVCMCAYVCSMHSGIPTCIHMFVCVRIQFYMYPHVELCMNVCIVVYKMRTYVSTFAWVFMSVHVYICAPMREYLGK